jgi:hypothetical protein
VKSQTSTSRPATASRSLIRLATSAVAPCFEPVWRRAIGPTVCGAFNRVLTDSPTAGKPCRAGRVRTRLGSILYGCCR